MPTNDTPLTTEEFRFNSGYRDGVNAVNRGLSRPWDTHPDSVYADGWFAGATQAEDGRVCDSSISPWKLLRAVVL